MLYFLQPCRASAKPTRENSDPLLFTNYVTRLIPFSVHLLCNPLTPWRANDWSLEILAIHPSFQGQGHGRELAQWGLNKAKHDIASGVTGVPSVVISAETREGFYQKTGFREIVGWSSRSVEGVPGTNPLRSEAVGEVQYYGAGYEKMRRAPRGSRLRPKPLLRT